MIETEMFQTVYGYLFQTTDEINFNQILTIFSNFKQSQLFVHQSLLIDIDSVERIDANWSQKLGLNNANGGRKTSNWCKLVQEITEN